MMLHSVWIIGVAVPLRVLTLSEAVNTAQTRQPQLQQARATTEAARARVDEAFAPIVPQVTGALGYQRATANYASRPGSLPSQLASGAQSNSLDTFNYFTAGLTLSQTVYDFGQTIGRWRSARASAESSGESERVSRAQVKLRARLAFFQARASKALLRVARDTVANQERHLRQIDGFVEVGTRPEIDRAQARTDLLNARVQLINAENSYRTAKAQLNQAMGVDGSADYDVSDDTLPPVVGEDLPGETLFHRAISDRPEFAVLAKQRTTQELALAATRIAYFPSLGLSMALTEAGSALDQLAWNWNAAVTLSWPLFQGGLTRAQVREARANLESLQAQAATEGQQVRLEVVQTQLAVRAAKETLVATEQAALSAREQLRLAEGRYATGAGNAIELGDAQVKLTNAEAQQVVAHFNLSSARAQLLSALGEESRTASR
jgi:outer membrane protein